MKRRRLMSTAARTVGFVGLGHMGFGMAGYGSNEVLRYYLEP